MTVLVVVVALVVAIATYLTWLARRLDRLAARVSDASGGLITQLVARADAAAQLAECCGLDELAASAARARAGYPALLAGAPLNAAVELAENALSRSLRSVEVAAAGQRFPIELHAVDSGAARVALARQFHNDAVRDQRALAGRRVVRVLHLSGRRPPPGYFEIDDALPLRTEPWPRLVEGSVRGADAPGREDRPGHDGPRGHDGPLGHDDRPGLAS
ncbi:hypothetical protein [Candidatus Frankia alpina]|uniref:Secreted protein n=1 Tax=Candidatus Frankia alpina TaxID=2699483 RepID=A0A4S5EUN7_9ACTN|nr:hypothetical protein [Candidatus Frankia alpina]THJ76251.1 hypothetical protein E7Y31_00835 [Candidatus Frankia alpina]